MAAMVEIIASPYIPVPHAIPIAAETQRVAAVVRPKTLAPCLKTVPPPIKPMPVHTCAATRAVSRVPSSSPVTDTSGNP